MIKRKRYYYMDFLAIISCFAVVVLRVSIILCTFENPSLYEMLT